MRFSRIMLPKKPTGRRPSARPQETGVIPPEVLERRTPSGPTEPPGERTGFGRSERVLHHPAYRVFMEVVRQEAEGSHAIDPEGAACLVSQGVQGLSRRWGCSDRTVRRRLRTECDRPKAFVNRVRLRLTIVLLAREVPTSVVARWLGFSGAVAYRRWVRAKSGRSLRRLRRDVRECTVSFDRSDCAIGADQVAWQQHGIAPVESLAPVLQVTVGSEQRPGCSPTGRNS
jgi:AraC-like DNA-binding protein